MAISIYCSINNFPPTKVSSKTPEVSCPRREGSWKSKCVLGLTCAVIGLELGDFATMSDRDRWAVAMDTQSGPSKAVRALRWSDERACQPWRVNSLETIVPENLPRPSARRRWEATGFDEAAPPPKAVAKPGAKSTSCFKL